MCMGSQPQCDLVRIVLRLRVVIPCREILIRDVRPLLVVQVETLIEGIRQIGFELLECPVHRLGTLDQTFDFHD
ncbi:hypothetical protein MES4922_290088 [Mesorhizobium ventifaucium]|uniref:Uncharacterized protein n=1 Tax=Mesorhizobium ventifaucium TaxID=666020 RepID=A0ABN8JUP2_9HYPH|nr:hypothetical protein MES4922_290088 [Mesorhizobium ventifaucium]